MRPKLNSPGSKNLELKYDILLSSFAFNFNLRRYVQEFHELSFLYFCHGKRKFALSRNWPNVVPCTAALWWG